MRPLGSVGIAAAAAVLGLAVCAIPAAAAAQTPTGRCIGEAAAVGVFTGGVTPSDFHIVPGTDADETLDTSNQPDLICGFGGNDSLGAVLDLGDVFVGGGGDDHAAGIHGTFYGGAGNDTVGTIAGGTFYGGAGNDTVGNILWIGTFNGGAGNDAVYEMYGGTFNGGEGNDTVTALIGGTFNGGPGDDRVISHGFGSSSCVDVEFGC